MAKPIETSSSISNDLSLYGLFSLLIRKWLIIIISGFIFSLVTLVWVINQPNMYEAETLLMPVSGESSGLGGLGALAGGLGGVASLAGINIPEQGDNSKLAIELLKSRDFIHKFVDKYDLVIPIMAAKSWDITSNRLIIDPKLYDTDEKQWIREMPLPRKAIPSRQEVYERFITFLDVEQDPKTKFVTVSIEFFSPVLAAEWTRNIVGFVNEEIRELDKTQADESIQYLRELAKKSYVAELKNVFSSLMEDQIKSKMLAEVRKDYVFQVIDPAITPDLKSKPKRAIITILGGFVGGIFGVMIVLYREGKKQAATQY